LSSQSATLTLSELVLLNTTCETLAKDPLLNLTIPEDGSPDVESLNLYGTPPYSPDEPLEPDEPEEPSVPEVPEDPLEPSAPEVP